MFSLHDKVLQILKHLCSVIVALWGKNLVSDNSATFYHAEKEENCLFSVLLVSASIDKLEPAMLLKNVIEKQNGIMIFMITELQRSFAWYTAGFPLSFSYLQEAMSV